MGQIYLWVNILPLLPKQSDTLQPPVKLSKSVRSYVTASDGELSLFHYLKKKWSEIIRVIYRNTFKLLMALSYSVQLWLFLFSLFIMLNPSGIQNTWKKLCIRLYMWKCRSDRIASFALFLHQNGFKYVNTNLNIKKNLFHVTDGRPKLTKSRNDKIPKFSTKYLTNRGVSRQIEHKR